MFFFIKLNSWKSLTAVSCRPTKTHQLRFGFKVQNVARGKAIVMGNMLITDILRVWPLPVLLGQHEVTSSHYSTIFFCITTMFNWAALNQSSFPEMVQERKTPWTTPGGATATIPRQRRNRRMPRVRWCTVTSREELEETKVTRMWYLGPRRSNLDMCILIRFMQMKCQILTAWRIENI